METAKRPCVHLGDVLCTRTLNDGTQYKIKECRHPAYPNTTDDQCASCPDHTSRIVRANQLHHIGVPHHQPPYPPNPKDGTRRQKRNWRIAMRKDVPCGSRSVLSSDPNTCTDRTGAAGGLANLYYGADLYLLLGGKSANDLDLSMLDRRGVISMAVNNAALTHRTNMFICGDPPRKFHDVIWRDPGIMCFVPHAKMWNEMYERRPSGRIDTSYEQIKYQPSVVGYKRNTFFNPETFLSEDTISFGNSRKSDNQWPPVLSTFFSALKMCYWLGAFRVFLLGCDWAWKYGEPAYNFKSNRGVNVYASNNASYAKMTPMLEALKPVFDASGFQVWNCYQDSKLTVFPYMPFDEAIRSTTGKLPSDLDGTDWYGKPTDDNPEESEQYKGESNG